MTRLNPRALAVAAVTAAALACAACGSSSSPSAGSGSSSPPASPSSGSSSTTATQLTVQQAAPLIVQCFADKHLIPASKLAAGKTSHPRSDSSTWLHGGKVDGQPAIRRLVLDHRLGGHGQRQVDWHLGDGGGGQR